MDASIVLEISEWQVGLASDGYSSISKRDKSVVLARCVECKLTSDDMDVQIRTYADVSRFTDAHMAYHNEILEEQKYRDKRRQERRNRTK